MNATEIWPYVVVASPGLFAVWKQWQASRVKADGERADLIRIAQDAAASVIQSLQDRIEALETELTQLRKDSMERLVAKDAELTLLRGELRQWRALAEAYERLLESNNIPHDKPGQAFWEARDGEMKLHPQPPEPGV